MRRRALVVALGTGAIAGCLVDAPGDGERTQGADDSSADGHSGGTTDTPSSVEENEVEYEQCDRTYVGVYFDLPDPAMEEAIAAIEDGTYETTDELILPQTIAVDDAYLTYNDEDDVLHYYTIEIERDGETTRLRADETYPETTPVSVHNDTETDVTFDVHLQYAATMDGEVDIESEGEILLEETVEVEAGQDVDLDGDHQYRYGMYRAEITVDEFGLAEELTWRMWHEYTEHGSIHLDPGEDSDSLESRDPDEDLFYTHAQYHPEGERRSCAWADDGELVEGPGS